MADNVEGFSSFVQILIYIGAVAASIIAALFGGRRRQEKPEPQDEHSRLTELMRQLDRAQTTSDIDKMRGSMEQVLGAMREAILTKIDQSNAELTRRVGEVEKAVVKIEARFRSRRQTD